LTNVRIRYGHHFGDAQALHGVLNLKILCTSHMAFICCYLPYRKWFII